MQPIKVAIQGFKGAFHQDAAELYFNTPLELVECLTFKELVNSVTEGRAEKGVMAIENSLVGSILQNYTLIRESDLTIEGEVFLRISQHLIGISGQRVEDIKEIHSHPMAIAQCDDFIQSIPHVKVFATHDTALSARDIALNQIKGVAAIASERAAREYGLEVIASSIESNLNNYTRFVVLGKTSKHSYSSANKASVAFSLAHKVGSLQAALQSFSRYGVNLTMLQSLPQGGNPWEYYFHTDAVFRHIDDFELALDSLKTIANEVKVLGIYTTGIKTN
ncbi:MAG: prephenate dehydratase domain-containing protein [Tenuifilum sp.]|uniref:prephenate dehydratase n=1 Tax=Tenuifilum sp. TaxID=2760880 RepID=UPI001B43B040|nr:prephenate dehydratase [Bacteroidales bacterium]HOK61698.1 prephenate dehydratase domain-containing protein [Tenuifilum sp.]MBP9028819.1 prephenate dehydratase [Bacteroidales bacterium]HOK85702.1 prephenate dehydratase domain-containing protein [Tenuifilum sp.]HON69850.1 prephenate dehydratase domain-containing protein [Tenuifilum sp.]